MSDHYRTLEIDRNASQQDIKKAYRTLAKKYHPDRNKSENADLVFKEINKAYEVLSDPQKKASYDQRVQHGSPSIYRPGYSPGHKKTEYSKSTIRKGRIFGSVVIALALIIPLLLLRFSSKYNYEKGLEYYENGELERSLSYLNNSIKEFGSRKNEACLAAINICYDEGYIPQGIAFAQKGISYVHNKKRKGKLHFKEGLGWEMMEQLNKADISYKNALDLGYNSDSVYIHLAMIHAFEMSNYEESIEYFDHLINNSGIESYRLQRGITLQKTGRTSEAIKDLELFITANPQNGHGHFFLGISLLEADRTDEACSSFQMAAEAGINESITYRQLYCIQD